MLALARGQLHALDAGRSRRSQSRPIEFEGDVAKRAGMGGLAAVDEVTMLVCPT